MQNDKKKRKQLAKHARAQPLVKNIRKPEFQIIGYKNKGFRVEQLDGKEYRIPINTRGYIVWGQMTKTQIVDDYAKAFCKEYNIAKPCTLLLYHSQLFQKLYREGWLYEVMVLEKTRSETWNGEPFALPLDNRGCIDWPKVRKKEKIRYGKAYIGHFNIKRLSELERGPHKNPGLQTMLVHNGLQHAVFGWKRHRKEKWGKQTFKVPLTAKGDISWQQMADKLVIRYCKARCKAKGILSQNELIKGEKKDPALYGILRQRGLAADVFGLKKERVEKLCGREFKIPLMINGFRYWGKMTDTQLEDYAVALRDHHRLENSKQLRNMDASLEAVLRARKILHLVFPKKTKTYEMEGRRFEFPIIGKLVVLVRTDRQILNIFAAALCRENNQDVVKLPEKLRARVDRAKVREYTKKLPILDDAILTALKIRYRDLESVPDAVLWAYGYEKFRQGEGRVIAYGIKKLDIDIDQSVEL